MFKAKLLRVIEFICLWCHVWVCKAKSKLILLGSVRYNSLHLIIIPGVTVECIDLKEFVYS
jgi:hypothetical protein